MKVTYTFDTQADDYDLSEHKAVEQAQNMAIAIWDIKQYLREVWKYQTEPDNIDTIRDKVQEILDYHGVTEDV